MSHIATFTINSENETVITCNNIIDKLNVIISNSTLDDEFKNELIKRKNILENKLKNSLGTFENNKGFELIKELDTLSKEVSNINWNLMALNYIARQKQKSKVNYLEYISKYGFLATQAIQNLENKYSEFTKDELNQEIEKIRHQIINSDKLKEFHQNVIQYIDTLNIKSPELLFELKNKILKLDTTQELSDSIAYIDSKVIEMQKIETLAKNVLTSLNKIEGFVNLKNKNPVLKFDKNKQHLVKTYFLVNKNNNKVQINIKGNMEISYKLGNYIGHACEKTTSKLLQDLKKNGYIISNMNITREIGISNKKQRQKALELKEL
ncbi:hypothetical protein [Mycoplasmopsis cricetuli]|uniref:hypothetical protein n=1 Tax=Mycoplasmopsis cricetuli TaxID=171283 RepID=UPI0012EB9107|nr:hypothetical protein [Mycoplasmopsis cricetuli]